MQRKDRRRREGGERGHADRIKGQSLVTTVMMCTILSLFHSALGRASVLIKHRLFNYESHFSILSYLAKWKLFLQNSVCLHEIFYTDAMKCCDYTSTAEKIKTEDGWSYNIDRDQVSQHQNTSCLLSAGDPASSLMPAS